MASRSRPQCALERKRVESLKSRVVVSTAMGKRVMLRTGFGKFARRLRMTQVLCRRTYDGTELT